jgi:hypothetical protein
LNIACILNIIEYSNTQSKNFLFKIRRSRKKDSTKVCDSLAGSVSQRSFGRNKLPWCLVCYMGTCASHVSASGLLPACFSHWPSYQFLLEQMTNLDHFQWKAMSMITKDRLHLP